MKLQILFVTITVFVMTACAPRRAENLTANYLPTIDLALKRAAPRFQPVPLLPSKVLLSLERYPCYGKCPVFKVEFFEDGTVLYKGVREVERIGNFRTTVEREKLMSLIKQANGINYFDFEAVYPSRGEIIFDVPLTVTYVRYGLDENSVENHHHAPLSLLRFEESIERLIETLEWKPLEM